MTCPMPPKDTQVVRYMKEVQPINADGLRYFVLALLAGHPGLLIVVDSKWGRAFPYCQDDNAIFPVNGSCPTCGRSAPSNDDAGVPITPPVQPLNTPV